jgi:hypothetical protein
MSVASFIVLYSSKTNIAKQANVGKQQAAAFTLLN